MQPDLSRRVPKNTTEILLNIRKEDGSVLVSKNEASTLANLKFKNGETMLSMEYRWFVYEIIWLLNKVGYESAYNYLTTDWEKIFGNFNIRKKMMFENPLMSPAKEKFLVDMEIYRNKVDVVEGGEKCRRCQSDATFSTISQTRSNDEAQTIRIFCVSCSYKWTAQ